MRSKLLGLSTAIALACGGTPPQTHDVTALPSASAVASAPPRVDLSPVAMPSSVVVVIHAAHVGATADMVAEWAGQPLDVDVQLADMVGEKISKLVDLDASADMVFSAEDRGGRREPDFRVAVSLPVKSFDAAKGALSTDYGLVPLSNGVFDITRTGHHRDGDSDFRSCALAPTPAGGGRVVCSHDAVARDGLVPYLTRGVGSFDAQKADVHVEARPGPFREIVRRERASITQAGARFLGGRLSRPIWEPAMADLCDSFLDADRGTLDASIDKQVGTVDVRIVAKTTSGGVTRLLTGHPERAEPPPATFLRLPVDSDVAFFLHGPDAAEIAPPKTLVMQALAADMADDSKLKDPDRKAILDAFSHSIDLLSAPVVVYARGVDFGKAIPAVSGLTEQSDSPKIKAGLEQAAGWDVLGAEVDPAKVTALAKEWTAMLSRPAITGNMDKTTFRMLASVPSAPPGTVEVSITKSHEDWEKKKPPVVLTLHVLVVPDQTRVWMVTALDQATALAKARALVAGTGTLASRPGLDAMKAARLNAGGFVTPRGVGLGIPLSWLFTWNPRYKAANDPLMGISSQAQYTTPVVFTASESEGGGDHALNIALRFPRPALQEVLQVGPRLFH